VTIYGLIDTTIHHVTHVNAAGNSQTLLDDGAFNGNRFGFKGKEDLGGGNFALFDLEGGFNLGNGASEQQGQLFGRQAFVGIGNNFAGTLTLGRQYDEGFDFLGDYDPIGIGNWTQNSWELSLTGVRLDNSIKYANNFGGSPVNLELLYGIGGQAGSTTDGATYGGYLSANIAPVKFGAYLQSSKETGNNTAFPTLEAKDQSVGFGATGTFSIVTPYAWYIQSKKDPHFAIASFSSAPEGPLAGSSLSSNPDTIQRKDKMYTLGLGINPITPLTITVGWMQDKVDRSIDYKERTLYGYVTWDFSKRTTVYVGLDSNHITDPVGSGPAGAPVAPLNGSIGATQKSNTDYGVGLRHRF